MKRFALGFLLLAACGSTSAISVPDGGAGTVVGADGATFFTPTSGTGDVELEEGADCGNTTCHDVIIILSRSTPGCESAEYLALWAVVGELAPGTYPAGPTFQLKSSACDQGPILDGSGSITLNSLTPTEATGSYETTIDTASGKTTLSGSFEVPVTCVIVTNSGTADVVDAGVCAPWFQ